MTPTNRQRGRRRRKQETRLVIDAVAYLDLGSGSLIVQLTIATIVAVPFFIRSQVRRILLMLRHRLGLVAESRNEPEVR